MLWVRRNGFQLPELRRDLVELRDFGFDVVLVGLGAPDDTPDELPPDRVEIEPFAEPATG